MHIHFLDSYQPRQSVIHRLDARVKVVLALAWIASLSLIPYPSREVQAVLRIGLKYALVWLLLMFLSWLARLGITYLLKRSSLALPFILAALPLLFTRPAVEASPLGHFGPLFVYMEGLLRFLSLALKSWLAVQVALLMIATTPFPELLQALRAIGLPRSLVATTGLTWRYLFVLADEVLRLLRARAARSGTIPGRTSLRGMRRILWESRVVGGMAASLFLRSLARADRIHFAMLARGYDGEIRSLPLPRLARSQQFLLFSALCFFFSLLLL
uniref:Cobalt/nickel transport system permease protein n=1 Tax=uncultured Chloroflexota bacterium TaxID=166587 RepID=H5SF39_9CHLR|nr:cobalt/nickel transport system permease protein [uncultured Chloroflexota bacterium]BAL54775.1 cobalt/nickel transport system permease protein [uncultured Chloroflexota bacterium]